MRNSAGLYGVLERLTDSILSDDIIEPSETRRCLIAALEVLLSKRRISRDRTPHGNIPL
jgi:acetyl-CoA carboxylase carboxyltransferase component